MKKIIITLISVIIIICLIIITHLTKKHDVSAILIHKGELITIPPHSPLRHELIITTVTTKNPPHIITLPAVVEANPKYTVNIIPPVTGRLTALNVNIGDKIKSGQVLATISSPDLTQYLADASKAQTTLILAEKIFKRTQSVNKIGGNALKDIEQASNNYNQALIEYQRAQKKIIILNQNNDQQLNIKAPIEGTITAINVGADAFINDSLSPLMTITNLHNIWLTVNIPENYVALIAKGQHVNATLDAYPNLQFSGTIDFVNALIDADTHCNKTRVLFANTDEALKPNMFATVKISLPQPKLIMIHKAAVLMHNNNMTVFVETAPWTFIRKTIILSTEDGNLVRVISGLQPNMRIITSGGILINDQ